MGPLRVFVGFDARETAAYHVLCHSIQARASRPVLIAPVMRSQLAGTLTRSRDPLDSTDFARSRFLVPHLSGYEGLSVFMDCDMLCLTDIYEVLREVEAQPDKSVWVCQHDYIPKDRTKFLGQPQAAYQRKNWSSFMVFANAKCWGLTPTYVNACPGLALHRFQWLTDDKIGKLSLEWNHLVGEYEPNPAARVLHYTLGLPFMPGYEHCDNAEEWFAERDAMLGVEVACAR